MLLKVIRVDVDSPLETL